MKNRDLARYAPLAEKKAIFQNMTIATQCVFVKNKLRFFLSHGPMKSEKGPTKISKKLKTQQFFNYPNTR